MKKSVKIPIRTCVGCQEKKPKKELLRIIRNVEGNIEIDLTGKKSGRGAYLCHDIKCLEKGLRENSLSKALDKEISPLIIEELRRLFTSKSRN